MTENILPSSTDFPLAASPEEQPHVFATAFNTGDPDMVEHVYEQAGIFVSSPGQPTTGTARREANARMASLGCPIEVNPLHVYVADDIALLIVDWTIAGTGPDGQAVNVQGTATDVARRGGDGAWRYIIDNPFGTATQGP
ncbi:YybH family protein [Kytococcus sedentarius]|uniref:YybH family protein n=1 Tax=Kytococcus sedentarius TaxID=1276 RepID=UPI00387921B4